MGGQTSGVLIMHTLTLDMNCLIDLDDPKPRSGTEHVKKLVELSKAGRVDLAICASCAAERQVGGGWLSDFSEFKLRLKNADLEHIRLLEPIGRWGLSFWGFAVYPTPDMVTREAEIFRSLFPMSDPEWSKAAALDGVQTDDKTSKSYANWRNKICDAQAFWAHEHYGREVFVTSDGNFAKRFPIRKILTPAQATADIL